MRFFTTHNLLNSLAPNLAYNLLGSLLVILSSFCVSALAQGPANSGKGFEAFKRNVYPLIRQQCASCHDNGGKGPSHSSQDPWVSYQKVLSYTNFSNIPASKFIIKGVNGHPASYDGETTVTLEQLVDVFQKWWNEGENTSFLEGKKVLRSQRIPLLPDDGSFVELTWDLSEIDGSLSGTKFVVDIQRYMRSGEGHKGAYRLKKPRFIINGNQNIAVQGVHIVMNDAYDPLANTYSLIQVVVKSEQPISNRYQIVTEKQSEDQDQIAFAFEKIQTTNQAPNVISTKTNKVTVANTTNTQSNLEAFNESSVGISARFISIKAPVVYEMGSIDNPYGSEQLHKVRLTNSFEIQATEVTQYQWYLVMKDTNLATPSRFKSQNVCDSGEYDPNLQICKNHPVELVSWDDIQVFINRLNQLQSQYTYRLPTEAEWEYVAKAGLPSEYAYGFGSEFDGSYAWYSGNSNRRTHKVASTPNGVPSPQNPSDIIYDMHGNVWEWVQDWYDTNYGLSTEQLQSITQNPTGPLSGRGRVLRGGSWNDLPQYLRSAYRNYDTPGSRYDSVGFRLVRTVR